MKSIKFRLTLTITICSLLSLLIAYIMINITINSRFNSYLEVNQNKRDERIVQVFRENYTRDGRWTEYSGTVLVREAEISNFTLSLLDWDRNPIWTMDPLKMIEAQKLENPANPFTIEQYVPYEIPVKVEDQIVGYVVIGQFSSLIISPDDSNFINSISYSVFLSAIIATAAVLFIAMFFTRQFSEPIEKISNIAYNLSSGELTARVKDKSDVTEIEKLRQSINTLGEKLDRQDTLRRRLVSDVSHELRNPLNVLQTNLEAIIDGILPATPERLQTLNSEVIRFGKLIDNLNILKQFESESMKVRMQELDLEELLQEVHINFQGVAKDKNIKLKFEHPRRGNFTIIGDKHSLSQVMTNILHNALKFTPRNGEISIKLYKDASDCYVRIKDNGIGIPKDELPYIFERFYRVDKSREVTEGSGIGLTIVNNIVKLHGGKITVNSVLGKGTVFTIRFTSLESMNTLKETRDMSQSADEEDK